VRRNVRSGDNLLDFERFSSLEMRESLKYKRGTNVSFGGAEGGDITIDSEHCVQPLQLLIRPSTTPERSAYMSGSYEEVLGTRDLTVSHFRREQKIHFLHEGNERAQLYKSGGQGHLLAAHWMKIDA
jgi:hypothetical protein